MLDCWHTLCVCVCVCVCVWVCVCVCHSVCVCLCVCVCVCVFTYTCVCIHVCIYVGLSITSWEWWRIHQADTKPQLLICKTNKQTYKETKQKTQPSQQQTNKQNNTSLAFHCPMTQKRYRWLFLLLLLFFLSFYTEDGCGVVCPPDQLSFYIRTGEKTVVGPTVCFEGNM